MRTFFLTFVICLLAAVFSAASSAQEWATFKARFVYEGEVPQRKELEVTEKEKLEAGLARDFKFLDESLLVDEKFKGIANVLIWVIPDPDKPDAKMPIHSSYDTPPSEYVIRLKNLAYTPHVSIMRTGAKLIIANDDPCGHHSIVDSPELPQYGRSPPVDSRERFEFKKETRFPTPIHCAVHPHEKAYVLVRDNPYFAVSNEKGEFEIKNLPIGEWRFKVWHEKAGYITDVKLGKSTQKWPKGEFKIKVEKIDFYLGDITVPAKVFDK